MESLIVIETMMIMRVKWMIKLITITITDDDYDVGSDDEKDFPKYISIIPV